MKSRPSSTRHAPSTPHAPRLQQGTGNGASGMGASGMLLQFAGLAMVSGLAVALLFCGVFMVGSAWASDHKKAIRAVGVEVVANRADTRLVFLLSHEVEAKSFVLENPDRVIIDLPEVNFMLPSDAGGKGKGLIASYRYGLFASGRSRIVIDLKEPALASRIFSEPEGAGSRLTIELMRANRSAYSKAAMSALAAANTAAAPENEQLVRTRADVSAQNATGAGALPLIMLDPGHGGVDPGASKGGLEEKDIVLAFARAMKEKLESSGRYRVVMTREDDSFVSLGGRVRLAREAQADLFISIHADSLGRNGQVRGATVYTNSSIPTDSESAELAAKENLADQIAGVETVESTDDVVGILADLTRRETTTLSSIFAGGVIDKLKGGKVQLNRNPHRSAGFRVLMAPDVPSILLEIGYLSSDKDAELMMSEEWRSKMVSALASALDRFFTRSSSPPQKPTGADRIAAEARG